MKNGKCQVIKFQYEFYTINEFFSFFHLYY